MEQLPVILCLNTQTKRLAEVKKSRRKLDKLSEQLSNRLSFLRREEAKILKSVSLARSKASQIISVKREAAKDRAQLEQFRAAASEQEAQQRAFNLHKESITEDRIAHVSKLVLVHKRNDARAIKLMKNVLKARNAETQQRELWKQRIRARAIRQHSTDAPLSHELYQQERRDMVGNWRHHRLLSEIQHRHSRLAEISALEEERMSIVQRLTLTQRRQEETEELLLEAMQ